MPEALPTGSAAKAWLRSFHSADLGAPILLCFPPAGGSATFFFDLSRALSPRVAVYAAQYPGRQDRCREPPISDLALLVDEVTAALAGATFGPIALFGHSLGALLSYEVARRLSVDRRDTDPIPVHVFASACSSPVSLDPTANLHQQTDEDMLKAIGELGGLDDAAVADPDMRQFILPALRADLCAAETYSHVAEPRLDLPIDVLFGMCDPDVPASHAERWRACTDGDCSVRPWPGGHFYLRGQERAVANYILARLIEGSGCRS